MKQILNATIAALGTIAFAVSACAGTASDSDVEEVPNVELDGLQTKGLTTTETSPHSYTGTAYTPLKYTVFETWVVQGYANFSGSANPHPHGICLLYRNSAVTCTSDTIDSENQCGTAPSGGGKYCLKANNEGSKTCWYRGPNTSYCAGSPATGGPVAPGSYTTPMLSLPYSSRDYVSYACLHGCEPLGGPAGGVSNVLNWVY